jgi:hypothetical protein
VVLISQLARSAETSDDGAFQFPDVPPGTYSLVASRAGLSSLTQIVQVSAGQTTMVDFRMSLSPISQEITVTPVALNNQHFNRFRL